MMIQLTFHSIWWLWLHVWGYSYMWGYTWSDVISYRFCIGIFPGYIVFVTYTSNREIDNDDNNEYVYFLMGREPERSRGWKEGWG